MTDDAVPEDTFHAEMEVFLDQVVATPDGIPLRADLYRPKDVARTCPLIVYIHGGGWRIGDRRLTPDLKRFFTCRGFAMASIEYRLSHQATFPAPLVDVKTAIRWLKSSAERYGFDPDRVGLWGSSAGGHLGSLCAATGPGAFEGTGHEDRSSAVQAVADGYGPSDFLQEDAHRDPDGKPSDDAESIQLPKGKHSEDPESLESLFVGAPIRTVPDRVAEASPAAHVKPGMPPFLIMHGLSDTMIPFNQSEILFEALARNGNTATLALIDGLGHGFFNRSDLDDAGPRTMQIRRCRGSDREGPTSESHLVFGLVEAFFRDHLMA